MTASSEKKQRYLFLFGILLLAILLGSAYYAFWSQGAKTMRHAVEDWIDGQRAAGLTVNYENIHSEGFPLKFRAGVANVEFADALAGENWRWKARRLDIDILPTATDRLIFSVRGAHEIYVNGAGAWRIESTENKFTLANDRNRLWSALLTSGPGEITAVDGAGAVSAHQVRLAAAPDAANHDQLDLTFTIAGGSIDLASILLDVPAFEGDISVSHTPLLANSRRWREAGGVLRLNRVHIEIEGAKATFSGAVTIDEDGFPKGKLRAEIINPAGVGRLLGKAGLLGVDEAAATETALALLAVTSGGKLSAPIIFNDGVATIAGVKLADLPKIH